MAVIWNSSDQTANITLSAGNLQATATSASGSNQQGVRANTSYSSGKYYFEYTINSTTSLGQTIGCGWANSSASMSGSNVIGQDNKAFAVYVYPSTYTIFENNTSLPSSSSPGGTSGTIIRVAFDIDNLLVWTQIGSSLWNPGIAGTQDPGTGTGGRSISGMASGPYFPVFQTSNTAGSVTANFGAVAFTQNIPSGFSPVDPTNTQDYNAIAKLLGYSLESSPQVSANAAKIDGFGAFSAPQIAASAGKFLGYVILDSNVTPPASGFSRGFIYG